MSRRRSSKCVILSEIGDRQAERVHLNQVQQVLRTLQPSEFTISISNPNASEGQNDKHDRKLRNSLLPPRDLQLGDFGFRVTGMTNGHICVSMISA